MIDLIKGSKPKWYKVRVTKAIREDLSVWLSFLKNYNGKSIITPQMWCEDMQHHIFTDASKVGYSGVCGTQWFMGTFPIGWAESNIAIKEFVPFFIALHVWKDKLSNSSVLFRIDNQSVVTNVCNLTSKLPEIMNMLRPAILFALEHNIYFYSSYIRSEDNKIADALSRLQVEKARAYFPQLDRFPQQFSQGLLPWRKQPKTL